MRSVMISTLISLVIVGLAGAQIPRIINYQGRLTDDTGQLVADGEYPVRFRIWNDSTDGMVKWTSQPETVLVINSLFNFQLGSKENIPPSIFNDTSLWLGITVGTGPEVPEIEPRTRLVSAPYAFKAYKAEYAGYADSSKYSDTANYAYDSPEPKVLTGAANGTTNAVTGKITVWFNPGHTDEFTFPPVLFVTSWNPANGNSKCSEVTSTTSASFEVQITESVGGALFLDAGVDVQFIAIGEN